MAHRFYTMSFQGTRSVPQDFDYSTDFAAMMHAGELIGSNRSVEIWHGTRFVTFTFTSNASTTANAVPEPMSLALLGSGLAAVSIIRWKCPSA